MLFECCVDDWGGACRAYEAGAGRLEVCSRLDLDGLTPETALLRRTVERLPIPVHAMIRPRAGDFVYDDAEVVTMLASIREFKRLGVHGLVFGALRSDRQLDEPVLQMLMDAASPLPVTFHRAFDLVPDPLAALYALRRLGVARILTSGGAPTAWEGRAQLRRLIERAADGPLIMPGGGVRPANVHALIAATGARELHGSVPIGL